MSGTESESGRLRHIICFYSWLRCQILYPSEVNLLSLTEKRNTITIFVADIRLIPDSIATSGHTVSMPLAQKMTQDITLGSSGCRSAGPHGAAVMDIQMSMIRDIMICRRLLPAVERLIVFRCLMRTCSSRPPTGLHSAAK